MAKEFDMNCIEIHMQTKDRMIISTTDLLPTLMFFQKCGWHIFMMESDDIIGKGKVKERNMIWYRK